MPTFFTKSVVVCACVWCVVGTDAMISTLVFRCKLLWMAVKTIWCHMARRVHYNAHTHTHDRSVDFSFLLVLFYVNSYSHRLRFNHFCFAFFSVLATAVRATKVDPTKMLFFHRMTAKYLLFLSVFCSQFFFTNIKGGAHTHSHPQEICIKCYNEP